MKQLAGWAAMHRGADDDRGHLRHELQVHAPGLEWFLGYPVTMAVMLGACGYLYYRFKRSGWL